MNGVLLRFYMQESLKRGNVALYEWLLERAKQLGIGGGSVFRGIAGFGHDGVFHEQHFVELAGGLPLVVEFLSSEQNAGRLLDALKQEGVNVPYVKLPAEFGSTAAV